MALSLWLCWSWESSSWYWGSTPRTRSGPTCPDSSPVPRRTRRSGCSSPGRCSPLSALVGVGEGGRAPENPGRGVGWAACRGTTTSLERGAVETRPDQKHEESRQADQAPGIMFCAPGFRFGLTRVHGATTPGPKIATRRQPDRNCRSIQMQKAPIRRGRSLGFRSAPMHPEVLGEGRATSPRAPTLRVMRQGGALGDRAPPTNPGLPGSTPDFPDELDAWTMTAAAESNRSALRRGGGNHHQPASAHH